LGSITLSFGNIIIWQNEDLSVTLSFDMTSIGNLQIPDGCLPPGSLIKLLLPMGWKHISAFNLKNIPLDGFDLQGVSVSIVQIYLYFVSETCSPMANKFQ
jgi:hypothetical protein